MSLSLSPFNLILALYLLYIVLIKFKYVPCITDLSKSFIMNWCCILSKTFLVPNNMIRVFFFPLVYLYGGLNWKNFMC